MSFGVLSIAKSWIDHQGQGCLLLESGKGLKVFRWLIVFDAGIALASLVFAILVMTSAWPLSPAAMYAFFGVGIGIIALDALTISLCPDNFKNCLRQALFTNVDFSEV